jgi:hypothetical protein
VGSGVWLEEGVNNIMNVNAVNNNETINYTSVQKRNSNMDSFDIGSATNKTNSSSNGKRIGLITIGDNAYIATYADNSTTENPIVKVGNYEVNVNDVNPENATELEMFALLSYMDDTNQTNNKGICSFGKMRAYADLAEQYGICEGIKDKEAIISKKQAWTDIIASIKQIFLKNKDTYSQAIDCDNLLFAMDVNSI